MEYFWNDRTIKDRVSKLKLLYSKATNEEERRLIKGQIDYVDQFVKHIRAFYKQPKLFEAYKVLKEYIHKEEFAWDPIIDYLDNSREGFSVLTPSHLKISEDEIISITHDFYKMLSGDIYGAFLEFYKVRKDHIRFDTTKSDKHNGYAYLLPSLNENFAVMPKHDTVDDVFAAIHESAHIIWSILNQKYLFVSNSYIEELIPDTMELIAGDYLQDLFGEEALRRVGLDHFMLSIETQKWEAFMQLMTIEQEEFGGFSGPSQLKQAGMWLGLGTDEMSSLMNLVAFPEMYRIIPKIYAIELYEKYKNNPKNACDIMEKIMKDETNNFEESLLMLENHGVIANENSAQFHKRMVLTLNSTFGDNDN